MCWRFDDHGRDPLSWPDIGQALGGIVIVLAVVLSAVMFTAAVRDRPSPEAREIIQAGRMMVGEMGR